MVEPGRLNSRTKHEAGSAADDALFETIIGIVQKYSTTALTLADLDIDLRSDLGIIGRHRFELAGELAETADLPGASDDTINLAIIEALAETPTLRAMAERLAYARLADNFAAFAAA